MLCHAAPRSASTVPCSASTIHAVPCCARVCNAVPTQSACPAFIMPCYAPYLNLAVLLALPPVSCCGAPLYLASAQPCRFPREAEGCRWPALPIICNLCPAIRPATQAAALQHRQWSQAGPPYKQWGLLRLLKASTATAKLCCPIVRCILTDVSRCTHDWTAQLYHVSAGHVSSASHAMRQSTVSDAHTSLYSSHTVHLHLTNPCWLRLRGVNSLHPCLPHAT